MFIELNMMITFLFIFRRPIIIGWGRDMGMIFWPIWNSIWICGWRLARQVDPIKIGFTGSPTLRPTTCGRLVVFQPLGAPNQYRAPNLRSSWPCSNTRLNSPTNTTTYQRSTQNSKRLMHNKERSLSKSKRLKHNKKWSMNNKKRLMNSFTKWLWTWKIVEHVRLILFGRITTSLLLQISSSSSSSTFILTCNKHYLPLKLHLIFFLKHIQFVMNII